MRKIVIENVDLMSEPEENELKETLTNLNVEFRETSMTKKVYYWKAIGMHELCLTKHIRTLDKNSYATLPIEFDDSVSKEEIFSKLNREDSPLATPEMQEWIRKHLQPEPHTSMSIGDLIEEDGRLFVCSRKGWTEVQWTQSE